MLGSFSFANNESNIERVLTYFLTLRAIKYTLLHLKEFIENHV